MVMNFELATQRLRLKPILASCDQPNLESKKVAERIGMSKVEERVINGNPIVFFKIEDSRTSTVE
jgi:[ribosomal protein S5]-alanine N-acetyltransferase